MLKSTFIKEDKKYGWIKQNNGRLNANVSTYFFFKLKINIFSFEFPKRSKEIIFQRDTVVLKSLFIVHFMWLCEQSVHFELLFKTTICHIPIGWNCFKSIERNTKKTLKNEFNYHIRTQPPHMHSFVHVEKSTPLNIQTFVVKHWRSEV